jgi:uncharacterized membrane protein
MYLVLLTIFYLLFPALTIYLAQKYSIVDKIGTGIICYGMGILLSVVGLIPEGSGGLQEILMTITVPLSIPLMLFNVDLARWLRLAGKTFLSLVFIIASVLTVTFVGYVLFRDQLPEAWQVAGMLIGVYTGGTPNLNAIGLALRADENIIILTNTADMLACVPWFFFILLAAQRLFNLFLPRFEPAGAEVTEGEEVEGVSDFNDYRGIFSRAVTPRLLVALAVAIAIFGVGGILYSLTPREYNMAVLMLTITTLGIGCSFIRPIRQIPMTFHLGQYIILVFCVVVGSMADIGKLVSAAPAIIAFTVLVVYGSWVMHLLLSFIFRIDTDTTIITSVSAIFSPPFVPVVASALKNREVVISGLATGIIGYAIGNYLGITIAYLLR